MRSRKHAQTSPSPVPLALLLIDVLTTFQFPDGDAIFQSALNMGDALVRLKKRARAVGIPVLYVNDNGPMPGGEGGAVCTAAAAGRRRLLRAEADALRLSFDIYTPSDCSVHAMRKNTRRRLGSWRRWLVRTLRRSTLLKSCPISFVQRRSRSGSGAARQFS
jgi:nicotinamidase-related amidase